MCRRVLSRNPRFATTHSRFAGHAKKLTNFPSSVSSCSSYRLHSTRCRSGHLRLRWKEHHRWGIPVTRGETQQLLQTDFPPARYHFQTRRGFLNIQGSNYPYQLEYYMRRLFIQLPCAISVLVDDHKPGTVVTRDELKMQNKKDKQPREHPCRKPHA